MNENVGASFGLSVLVVLFFAVVLYHPDQPRPAPVPAPVASAVEPVEAHPPESPPQASRADADRVAVVARPVSRRVARPLTPVEPRGAFTKVREGESLADVARRVYGEGDTLKRLWAANRDLLDNVDAPVDPGSVLRTP